VAGGAPPATARFLCVALLWPTAVAAQAATTEAELETLIATLENEQRREALLGDLRALLDGEPRGAGEAGPAKNSRAPPRRD
jgi:hypothetical protein